MDIPTPKVWILSDEATGRDNQCIGVCKELGLPFALITCHMEANSGGFDHGIEPYHFNQSVRLIGDPSQRNDDEKSFKTFKPPFPSLEEWPDVIVTCGKGPSLASGQLKKIASDIHDKQIFGLQLMSPEAVPEHFDLLAIPSFMDKTPTGKNVIKTVGVASHLTETPKATEAWQAKFQEANRPILGVVLGGDTQDHHLTRDEAKVFCEKLNTYYRENGGTLFIVNSPRTPPEFAKKIAGFLTSHGIPHQFGYWQNKDGAYESLQALSDELVGTGDSMSMLYELARNGKPLYIHTPESVVYSYPGYLRAHEELYEHDLARRFTGHREAWELGPKLPRVEQQIAHKVKFMLQERDRAGKSEGMTR